MQIRKSSLNTPSAAENKVWNLLILLQSRLLQRSFALLLGIFIGQKKEEKNASAVLTAVAAEATAVAATAVAQVKWNKQSTTWFLCTEKRGSSKDRAFA